MPIAQLFAQPVIWFTVVRANDNGRACRDYTVYDGEGTPLLEARAHPWRRDIVVHAHRQPACTLLALRRRVSFPLTGMVDVLDEHGERIGVVRRNGAYHDRAGRAGQFRDARTLRDRAREGVFIGVMEGLFGGDGTTAVGSAPNAYVWLAAATPVGTLARARLPFIRSDHDVPERASAHSATSSPGKLIARVRERIRALRQAAEPRGWKLEHRTSAASGACSSGSDAAGRLRSHAASQPRPAGDDRVIIAAALFAIELSHW